MPRIRSIHPGIFTDEAFMTASPHGRTLIMGLWCEAFDDGCVELKPVTLKARIFPVDNVDVSALLDELEGLRVFKRFVVGGKDWGAIRNFRKFQRPKKPNQSPVLNAEMADYVGMLRSDKQHPLHVAPPSDGDDLFPENEGTLSEFPQIDPSTPPSSEPGIRMEDGGDKMEEKKGEAGRPAYAQAREPASPPAMADEDFERECRHVVACWDPPKGSFKPMLAFATDREEIVALMREVVASRRSPIGSWKLWAEDVIPERQKASKVSARGVLPAGPPPDLVFIAKGTPEWEAWNKWGRKNGQPQGYPPIAQVEGQYGWRFKSRWPPGHTDNVISLERVA